MQDEDKVEVFEHYDRLRGTTSVVIPAGGLRPDDLGSQPSEIIPLAPELRPPPTLGMLLHHLENMDELLEANVNPENLVGDVRGKVDAIKSVLDRLDAYRAFLMSQIKPLEDACDSARTNIDRLKDYVRREMEQHHFEKLPGDLWRVQLQQNGQASLVFAEGRGEPTVTDMQEHPELVEMVRFYRWKNDKIRAHLEAGNELAFARLDRGKHVRFYLNKDTKKALKSSTKEASK